MRALKSIVPASAVLALLAGAAAGQNSAPSGEKDIKQAGPPSLRYRFSHVGDGVMRLDGQTGQVLHCKAQGAAWICSAVPEDGAVLKAQVKPADVEKDNKPADQISELQRQLAIPDEERQALKAAIEALRQDVAALKEQMPAASAGDALKADVARLRKDNEQLAAEAASLRKDIAALKTQVAARAQDKAQSAQIATLESENAALKERVAALQIESATMQRQIAELTPAPPLPPAPVPAPKDKELKMPSKEDMAQARAAIGEAWKRVMEMMNNLRKELAGDNDDAPVKL
jgi:polyhydroxyalkanoate synthesis regulator phasin